MADEQWRTYEEVAQYLLSECATQFGLTAVEGKQKVHGHRSGTDWEIDGKGVRAGGVSFVVLECRRHTAARINQEAVGAIAYRIADTGAHGALLVSPLGLQEGAEKVAAAERVVSITLRPDSTTTDYFLRFLDQIHIGLSDTVGPIADNLSVLVVRDSATRAALDSRGDTNPSRRDTGKDQGPLR